MKEKRKKKLSEWIKQIYSINSYIKKEESSHFKTKFYTLKN